jgi:hypothetical protein
MIFENNENAEMIFENAENTEMGVVAINAYISEVFPRTPISGFSGFSKNENTETIFENNENSEMIFANNENAEMILGAPSYCAVTGRPSARRLKALGVLIWLRNFRVGGVEVTKDHRYLDVWGIFLA